MKLEANTETDLFTDLDLTEEELLSGGGFFGSAWRWFKKNAGTIATGVSIAAIIAFGGSGKRTGCVTTNDGKDDKICTNF